MRRIACLLTICTVSLMLSSCVDHRDLRNEVFNENVYLSKDFLTRENPHRAATGDHAWLYKVTVTATSMPEIGMFVPGDNSQPRYVRFQFAQDKVEMVDDTELAPQVADAQGNMGPSPSLSRTVLNAWPGTHVDIQMKDNLDGERTNVIEENRERDWEKRQYFKVDFTKAAVKDVNMLAWYSTDFVIGDCMELRSASLVPGSHNVEEAASTNGDDYFEWTVALTYELKVFGGGYYCGNIITDAMDRTTFTYHVKYSFWRPPKSDYKAVEYAEKEPVRKKLMAFETGWGRLSLFQDPKTELIGAKSYLMRFDPDKPHTFYFSKTFPDKYKDHFTTDVAKQFNDMAQQLGAKMRIDFKDWNAPEADAPKCELDTDCKKGYVCVDDSGGKLCGKVREFGDIRYSILTYHNMPLTYGLIGMAYMNSDPRTGEILSGGFNMYDWIDRLYTYYLQDYLTEVTKDTFEDNKSPCTPGDVVPIDTNKIEENHKGTSLYTKLETYMGKKAEDWIPKHSDDFGKYMRMLLPDLRYAYPGYNNYVRRGLSGSVRSEIKQMVAKDRDFQEEMAAIDRGESPFKRQNVVAPQAMANGVEAIRLAKEGIKNHFKLKAYRRVLDGIRMLDRVEGWELAPAMVRNGRMCKADKKWETRDEWAERITDRWFKVFATHEFGHTLSLRHNFYGSMDAPNYDKNSITSSIMEYAFTLAEAAEEPLYHPHDMFALRWIYGGADKTCGDKKCEPGEEYQTCPKDCEKKAADENPFLFCTDEHSYFSPFCTTHDIGGTPTEIIKNEIDYYEWMYKFRNFRAFRKFWSTYSYGNTVLNTFYPMRRFLHLWGVDFYASNIKNNLMLLGVKGDEYFFNNITDEFNDELGQASRLTANFYKAILQQSAGERSYATKFDNFYGDVTQQGIILDKYFAMLLFLGLWAIDDYDQNIYAYMAYHEYSLGNAQFYSDTQEITDSMIGGQYDVYPWFKPLAVLVFAQDTGDIMFSDRSKQKWIEMKRFPQVQDLIDYYGFDPRTEATKTDNPYQVFKDKAGAEWIYYFVQDRNEHLTASKDKNPTAFKIIWDQNESINVNKYGSTDDFEIKYYCDYYNYFN